MRARTFWIQRPLLDVCIKEVLDLLKALEWAHELQLKDTIFELDSKIVIDSFHTNKADVTELRDMIEDCRRLWLF